MHRGCSMSETTWRKIFFFKHRTIVSTYGDWETLMKKGTVSSLYGWDIWNELSGLGHGFIMIVLICFNLLLLSLFLWGLFFVFVFCFVLFCFLVFFFLFFCFFLYIEPQVVKSYSWVSGRCWENVYKWTFWKIEWWVMLNIDRKDFFDMPHQLHG